jgi:hypothetical protein
MKVKLKLNPGERGTKKMHEQYGDKLLCVRYRYDEATKKRYKTVELIVDTVKWTPPPPPDTIVFLKIRWDEKNIQEEVFKAGGKWDKQKKLWVLDYGNTKNLGLTARIRSCCQISYWTTWTRNLNGGVTNLSVTPMTATYMSNRGELVNG